MLGIGSDWKLIWHEILDKIRMEVRDRLDWKFIWLVIWDEVLLGARDMVRLELGLA